MAAIGCVRCTKKTGRTRKFCRNFRPNSEVRRYQTAVLRFGDALKRTVLPAFTLTGSPVRGFSALRALVLRTVKVPKLGSVKPPVDFSSFTIAAIRSAAA